MALKKKLSIRRKTKVKKAKKTAKRKVKNTPKKAVNKLRNKKKTVKKTPVLKKKTAKRTIKLQKKPSEGKLIGSVTHYFPHVKAAVIKLKEGLSAGEKVKIKGHTTDLMQIVTSMQIDRVGILKAKKGDEIGLQVSSRVRQGDKVFKI